MVPEAQTVLVGLSGGVDSAVAAALLRDAGWNVTGAHLRMLDAPPAARHANDARRVADALGIPLIEIDARDALEELQKTFGAEYARGRTPNPCVLCNADIKFAALLAQAHVLGFAQVATGHYARTGKHAGRAALFRAAVREKDQSYALHRLSADVLRCVVLPLGNVRGKTDVRRWARALGLPVHDKADSQEVCFVPDDDYVAWLAAHRPDALTPGPIVDAAGTELGRHAGYSRYTVGQRRGLGVAVGEPLYVTAIDAATATVTVGRRSEAAGRNLRATDVNWQCPPPAEPFEATVQVRYNHAGAAATVRPIFHVEDSDRRDAPGPPGGGASGGDPAGPAAFEADFHEPVHAIAPGQAAVVYVGDRLLGGGWIDAAD